jgi:hypothetical protein
MPTLTISLRETAHLPMLGERQITEPVAHITLPDDVARAIVQGESLLHLPGHSDGIALDASTEIPVPFLGRTDIDLVVSIA